jgi:hypothetical protein
VIELALWMLERVVLGALHDAATLGDIALVVTAVAGYLDPRDALRTTADRPRALRGAYGAWTAR